MKKNVCRTNNTKSEQIKMTIWIILRLAESKIEILDSFWSWFIEKNRDKKQFENQTCKRQIDSTRISNVS